MNKILVLAAATLLLSACGGGGSSGTASTEPPPDTFTSKVLDIAASNSETSEATAVDSLTATAPEDSQPMPII